MIKAILFDLDGVLIETEHQTFLFYQNYLQSKGVKLPDEAFKYKAGRKSVDFFEDVFREYQIPRFDYKELTDIKRRAFEADMPKYVKKVTGGKELIEFLHREGYRMALVSQNERTMIDAAIKWLDVGKYFEHIISIEEITKKKPDPEIYLLAASLLKMPPDECVVVEDSKDGVGSAKAAKMKCIGVFHDYMPADALSLTDKIVHDLGEIDKRLLESI